MSTPRRCSSLVGRAELVLPMWRAPRKGLGPGARRARPPAADGAASGAAGVAIDPQVRPVRIDELDAYLVAAIDMFIGEVGIDPRLGDGGRGYRRRVAGLIAAGRAWARFEHGQVVFKAEVGRSRRRSARSRASGCIPTGAAADSAPRAPRRWPRAVVRSGRIASLYVNGFNTVARATYARIGFTEVGHVRDRPARLITATPPPIDDPSRCASARLGADTSNISPNGITNLIRITVTGLLRSSP